jgi:hypothetical protein
VLFMAWLTLVCVMGNLATQSNTLGAGILQYPYEGVTDYAERSAIRKQRDGMPGLIGHLEGRIYDALRGVPVLVGPGLEAGPQERVGIKGHLLEFLLQAVPTLLRVRAFVLI